MNTTSLSDAERAELDTLLGAAGTDGACADVFALDGFLAALVVGPDLGLPPARLPGLPVVCTGHRRASALIARHYDALRVQFGNDPDGYRPMFLQGGDAGGVTPAMTAWCAGFLAAIQLHLPEWRPLLDDQLTNGLVLAATVFGTEAGRGQMAAAPQLAAQHQQIADRLTACTVGIYFYWRYRRAGEEAPERPVDKVLSLCPCGSNKSFERCCGTVRTLH